MCLSVLLAVLLSWYQYHFSDLFSEKQEWFIKIFCFTLFLALKSGRLCVNLDVFWKAFVCFIGVVTTYLSVWPLILNWTLTFSRRLKLGQVCWLTLQLLFPVQEEIIYFRCKYLYRVYGVLLLSVGSNVWSLGCLFSFLFFFVYCNDLLFSVLSRINSCWLL